MSKKFEREMRKMMREYNPVIIILSEPKISGEAADKVCGKLEKKRWVRSEASGFNGGVWILWNEEEVSLKLLAAQRSFSHMEVGYGEVRKWANNLC